MKKLRVGVVGVGHIGSNHARLYAEIPSAEFTAVYDVEPSRSRTIASKFGAASAKSLDDFIGMVDAASVATPTNTHYDVARALLAKGKHVLVEKPITDNTAHATELAELAALNALILQVGHVERFNPVLGALEKHLTHPRFIESHRLAPYTERSADIGVVLDLMIHDLEVILHFVRSPLWSIDAVGVPGPRSNMANHSSFSSRPSLNAQTRDASRVFPVLKRPRRWNWPLRSRSK